ncbi:hypothetical protein RJ639_002569 [Escallonia herrerae]|uniref:Germin-like protein n=1 Tax=Escallonia herrerae TaxID=1293975 RepID=A0AA88XAU4_9ASTE|nr:hypothetical protein RJ639_002569 [Escallonia herrerae]
MKSCVLLVSTFSVVLLYICTKLSLAVDSGNIQDMCPTDISPRQTMFINGLPCKNPANVSASDFKTSLLNQKGLTGNIFRSSTTVVTAADFPGLNTLGLSTARTDIELDGQVFPHSHPRATEMCFVSKGVVIAGFMDSNNQLFKRRLAEGDVYVFPRGLLHYFVNFGFELATVFSVFNSQNPGMASIAGAMRATNDSDAMKMLITRLISLSKLKANRVENVTLFDQF